jgi:DNA-binding transcriptional LysR family regulator
MHINEMDLNLLRLFDAVYRSRNVSRAAHLLGMTQPAASQGLTRLRLLLKDPLFIRTSGGVAPTATADQLAQAVAQALGMIETALNASAAFEPRTAARVFNIHLSDIGEARFLPALMHAIRELAPNIHINSAPVVHADIANALDSGQLDIAIGFLPSVTQTRQHALLHDRYSVLLRKGHPLLAADGRLSPEALQQLDFAAVRSHAETLHILQLLQLDQRLRLKAAHFLALPDIVRQTDLAVLMPRHIAQGFAQSGDYVLIDSPLPLSEFTVSLHWSSRFDNEAGNAWLRGVVVSLFAQNEK